MSNYHRGVWLMSLDCATGVSASLHNWWLWNLQSSLYTHMISNKPLVLVRPTISHLVWLWVELPSGRCCLLPLVVNSAMTWATQLTSGTKCKNNEIFGIHARKCWNHVALIVVSVRKVVLLPVRRKSPKSEEICYSYWTILPSWCKTICTSVYNNEVLDPQLSTSFVKVEFEAIAS
jgi:hypothetical protein